MNRTLKIMVIDHPIVASDIAESLATLGHDAVLSAPGDAIGALRKGACELVVDTQTGVELNEYCANAQIPKVNWLIDWVINPASFKKLENTERIFILTPFAGLMEKFKGAGYKNVHCFPPGANLTRLKYEDHKSKNIVFIGDPISDIKYEYPSLLARLDELKPSLNDNGRKAVDQFVNRLESVIERQINSIGKFIAPEIIERDSFIKNFPTYNDYDPSAFPFILGKEATSRLRVLALKTVCDLGLTIYGPKSWLDFPELAPFYRGSVEYNNVGRVLSEAKITINLSRVFNLAICRVMESTSTGTLLITEERDEVSALFERGEQIVTYKDMDELRAKTVYYLENDAERSKIAQKARARVEKEYDMATLLEKIIEMVFCAKKNMDPGV